MKSNINFDICCGCLETQMLSSKKTACWPDKLCIPTLDVSLLQDIKTILNLKEGLETTLSSTEKIGTHYFEAMQIYEELTSDYNSKITNQIRGFDKMEFQMNEYNASLQKMLSCRLEDSCRDAFSQTFDSPNQNTQVEEIRTLVIQCKKLLGTVGVKGHMQKFIQALVEEYFL